MAYTVPPAAPRTRPTVVTAAVVLLLVAALTNLIDLVVRAAYVGTQRDALERVYEGVKDGDTYVSFTIGVIVLTLVISGVFALALVILALLDARGARAARIITWIVGGLYLCCATVGLAGSAIGSAMSPGQNNNNDLPEQSEVNKALSDALPSWYGPLTVAAGVIALLAVLAAVILLALPAANEYFRKRQPADDWETPAYPGGAGPVPPYPGPPSGPQSSPPSGPQSSPPSDPQGNPPSGPPTAG